MEPIEIEQTYRAEMLGSFPHEDCRKLRRELGAGKAIELEGLVPDLDTYCSFVAGFASSASRLHGRSLEQLKSAIPWLDKDFFDWFPVYRFLTPAITPDRTPGLYRELSVTDTLRKQLAELVRKIVAESRNRQDR